MISIDNIQKDGGSFNSSAISWSHAVSGSDRLLVVKINQRGSGANRAVSSITYNGVAMTLVRTDRAGLACVQTFILVNPATGTNTISVSMDGLCQFIEGGSISLTEVDTTDPLDDDNGGGTVSGSASISLTTTVDDALLIASVFITQNPTPDGSQTQAWETNIVGAGAYSNGSYKQAGTAGSKSMDYTFTSDQWAASAIAIKPLFTGTDTNSERDAKITGKQTSNSERDAKLTGVAPSAVSERSAKLSGVGTFYTRQGLGSLPSNDNDLATVYDSQDFTDVETDDGTRVALDSTNLYLIHQFKKPNVNNTDPINILINLQSSVATSIAPVYLQIYNYNSTSWETLDTENTAGKNTDFDLQASVSVDVGNYYDALKMIAVRVVQDFN